MFLHMPPSWTEPLLTIIISLYIKSLLTLICNYHFMKLCFKSHKRVLAVVAKLVGVLSYKMKGYRFSSQSGHMPGLQVQSLVTAVSLCFLSPFSEINGFR